jgi:hypothetical protein
MKWIFALLFLFPGFSQAQEMNIVAGMRADTADEETAGNNTEGRVGFQGGGIVLFDATETVQARTGLLFTTRSFDVKSGATVVSEPRLYYFDVPVGALFKVNEYAGAFAGLNGSFNISKSCGTGGCSGVKTFTAAAQVGGNFRFTPRVGADLYYEHGLGKLADNVDDPRAVVAQVLLTF